MLSKFFGDFSEKFRFSLGLKERIILVILLPVFFVVFLSGGLMIKNGIKEIKKREKSIDNAGRIFSGDMRILGKDMLALAKVFSGDPDIRSCMVNTDRERLMEKVIPLVNRINRGRKLKIKVHFHQPPCKSFLRVWKPKKWGDDLSSFRFTVWDAIHKGKEIIAVEPGRGGIPIRGVVPIKDFNGKIVGSVEAFIKISDIIKNFVRGKKRYRGFLFTMSGVVRTDVSGLKVEKFGRWNKLLGVDGSGNEVLLKQKEEKEKLEKIEKTLDMVSETGKEKELRVGNWVYYFYPIRSYNGKYENVAVIAEDISSSIASVEKGIALLFGIFAVVLGVFCVVVVWYTKRNIVSPIVEGVKVLEDVVEKREYRGLSKKVIDSGITEVKVLGEGLRRILFFLGSLLLVLKNEGRTVRVAENNFRKTEEDVRNVVEVIIDEVEKMERMVEESGGALTEMGKVFDESNKAVDEIARRSSEVSEFAVDVRKVMKEDAEVVKRLAEKVKGIEGVVEVIRGISERTKLLALNATIEAARAGEAGKGFAVVATEIKDLANEVGKRLKEIEENISGVRDKADEVIRRTEELEGKVGKMIDNMQSISSAIEEQSAILSEASSIKEGVEASWREVEEKASTIMREVEDLKKVRRRIKVFERVFNDLTKVIEEVVRFFDVRGIERIVEGRDGVTCEKEEMKCRVRVKLFLLRLLVLQVISEVGEEREKAVRDMIEKIKEVRRNIENYRFVFGEDYGEVEKFLNILEKVVRDVKVDDGRLTIVEKFIKEGIFERLSIEK